LIFAPMISKLLLDATEAVHFWSLFKDTFAPKSLSKESPLSKVNSSDRTSEGCGRPGCLSVDSVVGSLG